MSTPTILDASNVRFAAGIVLPAEPTMEPGCAITRQDYLILLEGPGAEKFKAACQFWAGIAVTALVGLIGAYVSLPPDFLERDHVRGWPLVFLVLLAAATIASAGLSWSFGKQAKKDQGRQSFVHCKERIEDGFKSGRPTAFVEAAAGGPIVGRIVNGQVIPTGAEVGSAGGGGA